MTLIVVLIYMTIILTGTAMLNYGNENPAIGKDPAFMEKSAAGPPSGGAVDTRFSRF